MSASRVPTDLLERAIALVREWEAQWGPLEPTAAGRLSDAASRSLLEQYVARLQDNYPFFHPRYAGQMLKPPHPIAIAAYLAAMVINPNNHALDGGPATGTMEKEVIRSMLGAFGLPEAGLGHLTTSGTIANLEALWIARELHPEKGILVSEQAHYTHERMAALLRLPVEVVPVDARGRMDPASVQDALRSGRVGTVVATAGTTGLGAVDPIADLARLAREYGARLHVDAAYGGFFRLLAEHGVLLSDETTQNLQAMSEADSIVVDPHKHGLQPYGCGCVLFRDASVGRFYKHDSPYTYFTSDDLHLGEISLECSRAGAAAGALWLTLKAFPLTTDGLGQILAATRRAAVDFHRRAEASGVLRALLEPELDIVGYYPRFAKDALTIDAASQRVFEMGMNDPEDPVFVSVLRVPSQMLPSTLRNRDQVRVLRSVLMKPEHEQAVPWLIHRLEALTRRAEDEHGA